MAAGPGRVTTLISTAAQAGVYRGQCAEYCGAGHAAMPFEVVAHDQAELDGVLALLPTHTPGAP